MDNNRIRSRVIINGDDFGLTQGINKAIERLHHRGRLNSTSLLVNTTWSEEAIEFALKSPELRLGIHLNLSTGSPLSSPESVATLVRRDGRFYEMPVFLSRLLANRIKIDEVELELKAQIEKALNRGLKPQHLDSHMHFHAIPALAELVNDLARYYGIETVRNPNLSAFLMPSPGRDRALLDAIYGTWGRLLSKTQAALDKRNQGVNYISSQSSDQLLYLRWFLRPGSDPVGLFQASIDRLDGRSLEIIAHPAEEDETLSSYSRYVKGRQREFSFLNSDIFSKLLEENELSLL
jgi:predicted glycoside hydrolase/deacetylase ChbG (UPF0249 family)